MKISFNQAKLREIFLKIFSLVLILTVFYHTYLLLVRSLGLLSNKYIDFYTECIKFIAFYISVIPIKVFSIIYPDGYTYIESIKLPFTNNGWVFILEQVIIILFLTITLFSIYIMLAWTKTLYKVVFHKHNIKKELSGAALSLGISATLYYVLFIILTTSIIRSFK